LEENNVEPGWTVLFGYLADAATMAGLVISVLAWRRASGAERAAKEARAAIRQANAAESLQALRVKAREFLLSVQRDQLSTAFSSWADILSEITVATERWPLPEAVADRLRRSVKSLKSAYGVFAEGATFDKRRFLEDAHELLEAVSVAIGMILERIDKGTV
jgi:hypothetical protein